LYWNRSKVSKRKEFLLFNEEFEKEIEAYRERIHERKRLEKLEDELNLKERKLKGEDYYSCEYSLLVHNKWKNRHDKKNHYSSKSSR